MDFKSGVEKLSNFYIQRVKITVKAISSIKISFDKFIFSDNAEMYIYNPDKTIITGPISKNENISDDKVWNSNSFSDSSLIVEIKSPKAEIGNNQIHISRIFVSVNLVSPAPNNPRTDSLLFGRFNTSSSCNINVLCPQGNDYVNERKAVCEIESQDMSVYATGELLMNTCSTNIPYLLTAKHVTDGIDVTKANYIFGWWSETCTPNTYNQQAYLFNGGGLVASNMNTDFSLLKLFQTPPSNYDITYLGWSRSSTAPSSSVCISHPMGDQMKISFANNPASLGYIYSYPNTAWRVLWNSGTVEFGSSGSPLLDPDKRVVGQLYSNTQPSDPACNQQTGGTNCGRFDLSWTGGGTNATRLSDWLDPDNSGVMTINTTNIANLKPYWSPGSFLAMSGSSVVCGSSASYTIPNAPDGSLINWQLTAPVVGGWSYPLPYQNVCTLSATGNNATLTKTDNGTVVLYATITQCDGTQIFASKEVAFGVSQAQGNGAYANSIATLISGTVNFTNVSDNAISMASPTNNQYTFIKTGGSSNAYFIIHLKNQTTC